MSSPPTPSSSTGSPFSNTGSGLTISTVFTDKLTNSLTKAAATKQRTSEGGGSSRHHQQAATKAAKSAKNNAAGRALSPPPILHAGKESIHFLAISDFGNNTTEVHQLAYAMNQYCANLHQQHAPISPLSASTPTSSSSTGKVDFILGLGDNFYPYGVYDQDDHRFRTLWRDIFLLPSYPYLRVPWRMILGNHDYMGDPDAQIQYHYNTRLNYDSLWYMPSNCYEFECELVDNTLSSSSSGKSQKNNVKATFYALDTNACQSHVIRSHPNTVEELRNNIQLLNQRLKQQNEQEEEEMFAIRSAEDEEEGVQVSKSSRHWKIVFGHHPLYTQGKGHSACSNCLRDSHYQVENKSSYRNHYYDYDNHDEDVMMAATKKTTTKRGFGLEKVLMDGKVDAVFAGHEHVFQVSLTDIFFVEFTQSLTVSFH